jgi:hypothetical protein
MSISKLASKFSGRMMIVAILIFLISSRTTLKADTYQIFNLGTDAAVFFYGMDDSGAVVLSFDEAGPCENEVCYKTFVNGLAGAFELDPPNLDYDSGGSCTPVFPLGAVIQHAVCNNGREAFSGFLTAGLRFPGIYTGSDSPSGLLTEIEANSGEGPIFMNSVGDIVWDDHFSETFMEAVDLTPQVPEPGSISLLGIGALAAAGSLLHRRQPQK